MTDKPDKIRVTCEPSFREGETRRPAINPQDVLDAINERWFSNEPPERPSPPPGWYYCGGLYSDWIARRDEDD